MERTDVIKVIYNDEVYYCFIASISLESWQQDNFALTCSKSIDLLFVSKIRIPAQKLKLYENKELHEKRMWKQLQRGWVQ